MELTEIIGLWKEQNSKIDKCLNINTQLLKESLQGKVKSTLHGLKITRIAGIAFGIIWCAAMLLIVIASWSKTNLYFKSAIIIHISISITAIALYVYHLVLLKNFNYNQTVIVAQQRLLKLKLSNLKTLGLLWIQLPVFSIWFMSNEWMLDSPATFWFVQVPIVIIQLFIGIWLYMNLNIKNQHKKWFKWFMSKGEFKRIQDANEILNEIHSLNA